VTLQDIANTVSCFYFRRNLLTEQQAIYRGHDTRKHPVPKAIRHDAEEYIPPVERFESETCHKVLHLYI